MRIMWKHLLMSCICEDYSIHSRMGSDNCCHVCYDRVISIIFLSNVLAQKASFRTTVLRSHRYVLFVVDESKSKCGLYHILHNFFQTTSTLQSL